MTAPIQLDLAAIEAAAKAATPQDFDSAELKVVEGSCECPACGGEGSVELTAEYTNYDNVAIGVQFFGIGHEFGAAEAYYRAAKPAVVLELIRRLRAAEGLQRSPDSMSVFFMHDNHTFTRLVGGTIDELLAHADQIEASDGGSYGSIGQISLLLDGKEVRRVGPTVHSRGAKDPKDKWNDGKAKWRAAAAADPDVMRLQTP